METKMKRFFLPSVLILLFSFNLMASERPSWAKESFFVDLEKSYIHVVSGSGYDVASAREKAMELVIKQRSIATGVQSRVTIEDGKTSVNNEHNLTVQSRPLAEYVEEGGAYPYTVYVLVQTAKNPTYQNLEKVNISTGDYPFSARVFVPGMAQIYKGQKVKGGLFIAGEALFIGGIATSFGMSAYYKSRRNSTHDAGQKQSYTDWANYAGYAGWGFVGAAVVLYIANIIDGAVSKGEPFIEADGKKLSFMPIASPYSFGLAMNLNF